MKKAIKRLVPDAVIVQLRLARARSVVRREFALDRDRYLAHMLVNDSHAHQGLTGKNLEAQVTKDYHRIEKGMALREPRRPFGADPQRRLDMLIPLADRALPYSDHATTARQALQDWNAGGSASEVISPVRIESERGLDNVEAFFTSRHSVRDFSDRAVDRATLEHAVQLAINTPSVCNRQAWQVRFFDGEDRRAILGFQNGNSGFRDAIPIVGLVTVDARFFAGAGERNQAWIEGGLFSMSLVWALHGLGLDSCMLNMSVLNRTAEHLRQTVGMDPAELVVMMIAVGHAREGHRRARSPRRAVSEVLVTT